MTDKEQVRAEVAEMIVESVEQYVGVLGAFDGGGDKQGPLGGTSRAVLVAYEDDNNQVHGVIVQIYADNRAQSAFNELLEELEEELTLRARIEKLKEARRG
jgi:hypothetical protein